MCASVCVSTYIFQGTPATSQFSATETFKGQEILLCTGISCPLLLQAALTPHQTDGAVGMLNQGPSTNWALRDGL